MSSSHGQRPPHHPPPSPPPGERQNKRRRFSAHDMKVEYPTASNMSLPHAQLLAGVGPSSLMANGMPQQLLQASMVPTYQNQQSLGQRQVSNLRIGNFPLEDALLSLPPGLPPSEHLRRHAALAHELAHQEQNPPSLPPSKVEDLPPKPFIPEFLKFPEGISEPERLSIEEQNNRIAAEHQRIDRQRNNQAAKKSRQARLEALKNTRTLLNEKVAECMWFRMKVLVMGGSVNDWERVPKGCKAKMVKEIEERVASVDATAADLKKKEDSRKRTERNRRRAEERTAGQIQGEFHSQGGEAVMDEESDFEAHIRGGKNGR